METHLKSNMEQDDLPLDGKDVAQCTVDYYPILDHTFVQPGIIVTSLLESRDVILDTTMIPQQLDRPFFLRDPEVHPASLSP